MHSIRSETEATGVRSAAEVVADRGPGQVLTGAFLMPSRGLRRVRGYRLNADRPAGVIRECSRDVT